jgi:hypothetical protein
MQKRRFFEQDIIDTKAKRPKKDFLVLNLEVEQKWYSFSRRELPCYAGISYKDRQISNYIINHFLVNSFLVG